MYLAQGRCCRGINGDRINCTCELVYDMTNLPATADVQQKLFNGNQYTPTESRAQIHARVHERKERRKINYVFEAGKSKKVD